MIYRTFTSKLVLLVVMSMPLYVYAADAIEEVVQPNAAAMEEAVEEAIIEAAEELADESKMLVFERPNKGSGPTEISVGMYIFDIAEVDDVKQLVAVDVFLSVSWNDPRLALPEDRRLGAVRVVSQDEIWTPAGLVVNDRGIQRQLPREARIDDEGTVKASQRLWGKLSVDLEFENFPFDTQYIPISFITYEYSPEELVFSNDLEVSGDDGKFSAEGWTFEIIEPVVDEFRLPAYDTTRPQVTYYVKATRNTQYYIVTMFVPMTLIIFMAWSVYWLQPNIIPARIAISTASIFSFVAFGLSVRARIPEVSYMTLADIFVTGCTMLVFSALAITVWGSRLANSDRMGAALRINAVARWAYLLAFLLICGFALSLT